MISTSAVREIKRMKETPFLAYENHNSNTKQQCFPTLKADVWSSFNLKDINKLGIRVEKKERKRQKERRNVKERRREMGRKRE